VETKKKFSIDGAEALTPHTKAVYEAGANLLKDSVATGREYCKSMLGTCFAAIPLYVALLKIFIPEKKTIADVVAAYWVVPIALFLGAAAVFSAGYLPGRRDLSLDLPEEIQETIRRATTRRFWLGVSGFVILCVGITGATIVVAILSYR
jgi:hypothetical protein